MVKYSIGQEAKASSYSFSLYIVSDGLTGNDEEDEEEAGLCCDISDFSEGIWFFLSWVWEYPLDLDCNSRDPILRMSLLL